MQLLMSNIQNKIKHIVNFIKHKKRIYDYTHYTHRGILLHLKQNNLTYYSTGKNTTGKFLIKREYKKRSMK